MCESVGWVKAEEGWVGDEGGRRGMMMELNGRAGVAVYLSKKQRGSDWRGGRQRREGTRVRARGTRRTMGRRRRERRPALPSHVSLVSSHTAISLYRYWVGPFRPFNWAGMTPPSPHQSDALSRDVDGCMASGLCQARPSPLHVPMSTLHEHDSSHEIASPV